MIRPVDCRNRVHVIASFPGASGLVTGLAAVTALGAGLLPQAATAQEFAVEEATIEGLHRAIQSGETTCEAVIRSYIERAQAYNGVCTALVTADGAPIARAVGPVRAGRPLEFPTQTVPVADVLPDLDEYEGLPLELGRMEPTVSDETVMAQFGMRVGIPNAGQVNALETFNIRGERSVTCKAACDTHPSDGPLPSTCPAVCESFREQPDAIERAAELDARYGTNPDLEAMPMYCVAFAWKNWYDAMDMRSTGGNDVAFGMDAPPRDSPDIAELRAKGAISYAIANAANAGLGADGPVEARAYLPRGNYGYGAWGGQPCNPYDTERVPRGSSSGSGVAVAANLAHCSICEQTGGSCKGPASRNNVVNLLTTKGILMDGGYGYQNLGDRAGILCRTVADAVAVLDSIKGYETNDPYTALPAGLIPDEPYESFLVGPDSVSDKPLTGMRVAVIREFMVKHTANDAAISDQIDAEIKRVIRDELGADLVETIDQEYPDDPDVPNLGYTFGDAIAEILAHNVPDYFWQRDESGELEFAVPGWDVTTIEYALALANGDAPLSPKLNLRRLSKNVGQNSGALAWNRYLAQRNDERVRDWASWIANAKFDSDSDRARAENALLVTDGRREPGTISYLEMQKVLRLIVQKVMTENGIDAFVNPETTLPPYKIGGPDEPVVDWRDTNSCCQRLTALMGAPEMEVPAGYTQVVYEPAYVLTDDRQRYTTVTGTVESRLPAAMPISLMLWAAPGGEPTLIKVASAYEAATSHRLPPADFGPVD